VTEVKDQVQAVDDEYTTDEDATLTVEAPGVLANDIDVDNNLQAASLVTDVQHGRLSLLGDGSFTYDPDPDFYGTDSFEYQLVTYPAPQSLWTDEATVTITINPVGDAPVLGLIEDATIPELVEFSFTATATDVDLPAQVLTFSLVGAPDGAVITEAGVFTWTPTEEQGEGVYTFTVMVCDDADPTPLCDEQEVTLTVTEVNAAPVAQDLFETTLEDTPVDVTLVATDAEDDALTYAIVDQPAHGTVNLVGNVATYTPELDFNGEDSFTYKANDGMADSVMAVVTITVTPVNDAPVAVDDAYTTDEDTVLTVALADGLLANDMDVDGDTITVDSYVEAPQYGTLILNADGSFTYTPDENFFGIDSFVYKVIDGNPYSSDEATVTIMVTPVNDWPIANDDFYEVVTGTDLVKDAAEGILANDVLLDPDEEVSIQILEGPHHGTLNMNDDGSFTYIPNLGYMGTDTFRYLVLSVQINAEWSDDATVTIEVKPYMSLFLPLILR
jgi:VCBS repeat-containing protein